jgi:acetyl esterase/lipase
MTQNCFRQSADRVKRVIILLLAVVFTSGCFHSKVLFFRKTFDTAGEKINKDLEKHVPGSVNFVSGISYEATDPDALLDIYYAKDHESDGQQKPVIFWIRGGGWIAGRKEMVSNYAKILTHYGYTVITTEYSLAPERTYPTPLRQVNAALRYLVTNSKKHRINMSRTVIGGDSGGAQIAAQTGIILTDSSYAKRLGITPGIISDNLWGMILYCGMYDFTKAEKGREGVVLRMMMRAYTGTKLYVKDTLFALGSVVNFIPPSYPPVFLSVGNSDPLKQHSYALADTLIAKGINTDTLFWESNKDVSLGHEYQFNLDVEQGKTALKEMLEFLEELESSQAKIQ